MQLNSITPEKSRQWPKIVAFLGLVLFLSFLAFYFLKNRQENSGTYHINPAYQGWLQWGSEKYPYKNFNKAFQIISKRKISSPVIHLKNGEYNERMEIAENAKVFGESRDGVIFRNDHLLPIITMKNNSEIYNITTVGGSAGILAEGKALIENCAVKEFRQKGIDASATDQEIIIKNSEIFNGDNKGIYIQRGRKISLSNNKAHDNKGEGFDVRDRVSGIISGNEIYNNTESGIEFIVGGSFLEIKENNIWDNGASGITCQYYEESPEKGKITIHANRIKAISPDKYTITVKSPSGGGGRVKDYWRESVFISKDNVLEGEIKTRSLEITE